MCVRRGDTREFSPPQRQAKIKKHIKWIPLWKGLWALLWQLTETAKRDHGSPTYFLMWRRRKMEDHSFRGPAFVV